MKKWALNKLIQWSGKKIIFPFYHIVSDEDCPHVKHLYPIKRIAQFEEELDFLQKHFLPLSLEELMDHIKNETEPEKPSFFLSFDDGLRECYTVIAPILKRRKIPAAFFLNTGFVGNQALFYRYKISLMINAMRTSNFEFRTSQNDLLKLSYHDSDKIDELAKELNIDFQEFLEEEKPYMNWEEIEELKNQGFYFGGHSVDHPLYELISLEKQIEQTKESVEEVIDKLKLDYRVFAFPFTDFGVKTEFFASIFNSGICKLSFGTAGIKSDECKRNLQRISMERNLGDPATYFLKKLLTYQLKVVIGKEIVRHI